MKHAVAYGRCFCFAGILIMASWTVAPEPEIRGKALPAPAARVLKAIMRASDVTSVRVTSTARTPAEQARVMDGFIRRHGPEAAYRLYGPEGDAVIAVYERQAHHARPLRLAAMQAEVRRQLPKAHAHNRLMHTKPTHYVFDVAISSVPKGRRPAFVKAARLHPRVSRLLGPTDGEKEAFHLEIPKQRERATSK